MRFRQLGFIFISFFLISSVFAQDPEVSGRLIFVGTTNDSAYSVWLSVTTAGAFKLEAQGQQLIDEWDKSRRGLQLSLSPVVSQGNGGTHFLINRVNDRILDSQNQQGGIVLPPLPSEPPGVMPPIVLLPGHPIVIPPESSIPPGSTTPPGATPESPGYESSSLDTDFESKDSNDFDNQAPLTGARQSKKNYAWNIWSDNRYFNTSDQRYDLDAKGKTTSYTIGADRLVAPRLVLGSLFTLVNFNYGAFDGGLVNRASGFKVGPYFGYSISRHWSIDGEVACGQLENHNKIAILNSQYNTILFEAFLHATGLYQFGHFQLRPKPLISLNHFRNPAYQFNGVFRNIPFQIYRGKEHYDFNFTEFKLEANYSIKVHNNLLQPYVEAGVDYAFARPNDGQILTGNLTLATPSPFTETAKAGIRTLISRKLLVDASGSYLSFGQGGLDVWEVRLLASYSFS